MRSSKVSAELDEEFGFAVAYTRKFVENVLDGVGVGTIGHRLKGWSCVHVGRKDKAIEPMLTNGTRIKTLRDVSTDEKPNNEPSVVRPQELIGR